MGRFGVLRDEKTVEMEQKRGVVYYNMENLGDSNKLQHSSENAFSRKLSLKSPNLADFSHHRREHIQSHSEHPA